jgi:hypothetical protein
LRILTEEEDLETPDQLFDKLGISTLKLGDPGGSASEVLAEWTLALTIDPAIIRHSTTVSLSSQVTELVNVLAIGKNCYQDRQELSLPRHLDAESRLSCKTQNLSAHLKPLYAPLCIHNYAF